MTTTTTTTTTAVEQPHSTVRVRLQNTSSSRVLAKQPWQAGERAVHLVYAQSPERVTPSNTVRYRLLDVQRIATAVLEATSMGPLRELLSRQVDDDDGMTLPLARVIGKGKQSRVYTLRNNPNVVAKEYYFTEHVVKPRSAHLRSAPSSGSPRGENMNSIARRYSIPSQHLYACNKATLRKHQRRRSGRSRRALGATARNTTQPFISPSSPLSIGLRLVVPTGGRKLINTWTSPPPASTPLGTRCYRCRHAFLSEAIVVSLLSNLKCPHIVRYDGVVYHNAVAYIVMERLHSNLRDAFRNHPLHYGKLRVVKALLWQCCIAILAMQTSYRIVHYDMNAYNIFLKKDDNPTPYYAYQLGEQRFHVPNVGTTVKLGDFGFAGAFMTHGPHVVRDDVRSQRFEYKYNIANGFQKGYDVLFLLSCFNFALRRHVYPHMRSPKEVTAVKQFLNRIAVDMGTAMRSSTRRPLGLTVTPNLSMSAFIHETCNRETLRPRRRYSLLASPRHVLNSAAYEDYRADHTNAPLLWQN